MTLIFSKRKNIKTEAFMHHKNIMVIIRKQLKKQFPNWKKLKKKQKKDLARMVLAEVTTGYDFTQHIDSPKEELLGIENQAPAKGILTLDQMARRIAQGESGKILQFNKYKRSALHIKDEELRCIDRLIDDEIINGLLSYDGYNPSLREIYPSNLFRAELLKAIKYPEISYRKFCTEQYFGLEQKQNRVFAGLSLSKKDMIDHTQLCQFRKSLTFVQQVNLLVYILHHFNRSGLLGNHIVHAIDSTELANDCALPLATLDIKGKKLRIYNDLDCDCGKRRNKRDKSKFVIGYRLHTLTAISVTTGFSYPLVSLLAPANHHDSHFLPFLVNLAQAMGIDIRLITADEAYHDKDGSLFENTGVILTTPPSAKVSLPEHVDGKTGSVFCHKECSFPMIHVGIEGQDHEYKCSVAASACQHANTCPRHRFIPLDGGLFQRIPHHTDQVQKAHDIRKNCERSFNLLKNQTGLETVRVRSRQATMARCTLSSISVLLIKIAGLRKKKATNTKKQLPVIPNKKAA